ncbi:MAG: BatA domain-containing protein, partial [Fulvivirga sp.]|nr:BatA domain-containing protein [Fulvivirga sp.]
MSFVNPGYLFALAGLIVPLAIHLWSRKEGQVVKIGSLQFLPGGDTKKASSIQLNEITLLMLRLLLIALLVLAMAEPLYMREIDANSRAVFIDPSVKNVPWVKTVIDSLKENNENAHWFTPGFPTLTTDSINEDTWYWQLAGDLQDFPAANITVITGNQLAKTVGKRPTLNRTISWIIADNTNKSNEFLVEATLRDDSVNTRFGFSDNESTFFQLKKVAKADFRTKHGIQKLIKDTLYVVIHAEKDFAVEKKYFTKAFETIEDYTHWPIKQLTYQNITQKDTIDWLVWLGEGSPGN